jgi:maltooligosyltrehalose trehalohydrolase
MQNQNTKNPWKRRLPIGAEPAGGNGVHFRVWAPRRQSIEVLLECGGELHSVPLTPERDGYFSGFAREAAPGHRYRYSLDGRQAFPDPASRYQPDGPHCASQIVDPSAFPWTDQSWKGVRLEGQVIYEMHVGTFTAEGTWEAARRELPELAKVGITVIEMMPVAEFPGRFGWGYDGVDLFAPTRLYGMPDDLRSFVNDAHALGLAVILDVVYNHIGPDGNFLAEYSPHYFTSKYDNEWGDAINFDGDNSRPVRQFFVSNAAYWIDEYHMDGLRLDATQQIFDSSAENILQELTRHAREAASGREIIVVAENESQDARLARACEQGGYGLDGLWNDDFHHSLLVALTGQRTAYYTDYLGTPQEFIAAVKRGFLYQGQYYRWQKRRRGTPAEDLRPAQFITFLENHDQVANSVRSDRVHRLTDAARLRALTALLLLAPGTPMLFQGQEFAASAPFLFFADHREELAQNVREGRAKFLSQFVRLVEGKELPVFADPGNLRTFESCKLDFSERQRNRSIYDLHIDLLRLRREESAFRAQRRGAVDGAVLGPEALVLRFFDQEGGDRLLLVNLGVDVFLEVAPEPLLAPPAQTNWEILWSSEDLRYQGSGIQPVETEAGWRLPAHAAVVLRPVPLQELHSA